MPIKYEADQKHELQIMNFGWRGTLTTESPLVTSTQIVRNNVSGHNIVFPEQCTFLPHIDLISTFEHDGGGRISFLQVPRSKYAKPHKALTEIFY